MNEHENLFDAALLDESGVITNVLVFDNEDTMREFGAFKLADGQGIGDVYLTPEEYQIRTTRAALQAEIQNTVNDI